MAFKLRKYNSDLLQELLSVGSRRDKLGNIFYSVEYVVNGETRCISFSKMSSVVDFIYSNYQ